MHGDPAPAARARRELKRHYEGVLVFDAGVCPIRYVLDPASARLLFPAEPAVADLSDATLFVPEERDGVLQALLTLSRADPRAGDAAALMDRWSAYHAAHAAAARPAWLWGAVEATKFAGEVAAGEEVAAPDPLRDAEPRLCREVNADRAAVARACRHIAGVEVDAPVVVGVDAEGIDVRARFGIVRLEFDHPAPDPDAARERIAALLARGGVP